MFDIVWKTLAVGIGATALMDLWAIVLNRLLGIGLPNWAMVGRWFAHVPRGTLFHKDIAHAAPVSNELAIGWLAHYGTGIVYAAVLVFVMGTGWLAAPTFLPAFILGMLTIAVGWFLLQPGMGAGWAASRKPNPWQVRLLNLIAHTVFGSGLFATAWLVSGL